MQEPNQKPNTQNIDKWRMATLAFELGYIIAIPLVIMGLLGKYIDGKLGSEPWLTIIGILIAIVTTTVWMTLKFKKYINTPK